MSLDWNSKEIADWSDLVATWKDEDGDSPETKVTKDIAWAKFSNLIFATMAVSIGHIKDEETAWEFWVRAHLLGIEIDPELIIRCIGLRTNVSTDTRAAFMKHLKDNAMDRMIQSKKWAMKAKNESVTADA